MHQEQRPVLVQSLFLPFPEEEIVKAPFWTISSVLSLLLSSTLGRVIPGSVLPSHTQTKSTGVKKRLGDICSPVLTHTCDAGEHSRSYCVTLLALCKSQEPTLVTTVGCSHQITQE